MLLKIIQSLYELKVVKLRTIQIFLLTTAGNETFMATQCINICRVEYSVVWLVKPCPKAKYYVVVVPKTRLKTEKARLKNCTIECEM